jgi:hypothetical protein
VARPATWTGGLHHQNLTPPREALAQTTAFDRGDLARLDAGGAMVRFAVIAPKLGGERLTRLRPFPRGGDVAPGLFGLALNPPLVAFGSPRNDRRLFSESATLLVMSWPLTLYQGPVPIRSRALIRG